jgi:hypothetical protein
VAQPRPLSFPNAEFFHLPDLTLGGIGTPDQDCFRATFGAKLGLGDIGCGTVIRTILDT